MTLTYKQRENLQNNIEKFMTKSHGVTNAQIVNHFQREGIYGMIKRINEGKSANQSRVAHVSKYWSPQRKNNWKGW